MAFICGSFNNQEKDDFEVLWPFQPFPTTPTRKTTRRHSFCSRSNKDSKNPYSNRGLDKFEALLADLDGKRQKIFTQKGSEDISLVRFVYSNSNDVKPIVVKLKDQRKDQRKQEKDHYLHKPILENPKNGSIQSPEKPEDAGKVNPSAGAVLQLAKESVDDCKKKKIIRVNQLGKRLVEWWKPCYSLPVFLILIMVFLVFFGRSFTILCTSLGWYLVPTINSTFENQKKSKKTVKKEYSRKFSEKITSRSVLEERMNNQPHRRSF